MIEVEIRGELTEAQWDSLRAFLDKEGTPEKEQERDMILLRDYPGYHHNPTKRETDMRIKVTNGLCEFVLKKNAADGNRGRTEIILPVGEKAASNDEAKETFAKLREIVRAFGCRNGLWMHRVTFTYRYHNIEWALIRARRDDGSEVVFYEAEKEVENTSAVESAHKDLVDQAHTLDLPVLERDKDMSAFIYMLDREVNKEIEL